MSVIVVDMKVELGKYRVNTKYIQDWVRNKDISDIEDTANNISMSIFMPIIPVYWYLGEIIGFTPEILKKIEKLKEFYHITEVVE